MFIFKQIIKGVRGKWQTHPDVTKNWLASSSSQADHITFVQIYITLLWLKASWDLISWDSWLQKFT